MATPPDFTAGSVLTAAQMNAVGLWKVTSGITATTTGAGSSATVTNGTIVINGNATALTVSNAFSSDYDNYRIVINGGSGSTNITLSLALGASTTGYYGIVTYATYAAATTPLTAGDNNAAAWTTVGYAGANFIQASFDLIGPNLAQWTTINAASWAATTVAGTFNGVHQVATAYTGFTLGVNTGTITGATVRIYGYRK